MKKSLIAIVFAAASIPMFAAHQAAGQATPPVNPPASSTTQAKPAVKTKKHHVKKASKKVKPTKQTGNAVTPPAK